MLKKFNPYINKCELYSSASLSVVWSGLHRQLIDLRRAVALNNRGAVESFYNSIYLNTEIILDAMERNTSSMEISEEAYLLISEDFQYIQTEASKAYNDFVVRVA
jgi:hypothetical protein